MKYPKVQIRSTDLHVNPIGLGTNAVGGQRLYPDITDEQGKEFLRAAIHNEVDFWDTAYIYGPKKSEEIIGEVLTETKARDQIVLSTKAAHVEKNGEMTFDNSPQFLVQAVEESLKRLQTDYIDLFYIHFPDKKTPKYEAVGALQRLKEKGIIRAIGVSNFSLEQLQEANQDGYVNVVQDEYNLINRSNETLLFDYTIANNISFIPYFPFASGLLAGKYTEDSTFPADDIRARKPEFKGEAFKENIAKVDKIRNIAREQETEVANIVLAWYLQQEAIDVVIPGAKKESQVRNNLNTLDVTLTTEQVKFINDLFPIR